MTQVHKTHCCRYHGCKYGDYDCPVYLCKIVQTYTCEVCANLYGDEPFFKAVSEIPKIRSSEIQRRRDYARNKIDTNY